MTTSVTIYTKPGCIQCEYTEKFLHEKRIVFEMFDVSVNKNALAELQEIGITEMPYVSVMYADGTPDHWTGYRREKLKDLAAVASVEHQVDLHDGLRA